MEFSFDKVANVLFIWFSNEKVKDSKEIKDGIIIDYGEKDNVLSIEILNFRNRNLDLNELIQLDEDDLISKIIKK